MTRSPTASNSHGHDAGLTLLEILAATLIFSMVMTVLISTSSTAVHHVGLSSRRLEASFVADEIIADLEIQMKQGIAPLVDDDASTRDQFQIRIVRSDLVDEVAAAATTEGGLDVVSLLGAELPEVAKHLKQYDIEVSWIEQNGPESVNRTTFAYDWQMASLEFSELFDRATRNGLGTNQSGGGEDGDGNGGSGTNSGSSRNGSNGDSTQADVNPQCNNGHNALKRWEARHTTGCPGFPDVTKPTHLE